MNGFGDRHTKGEKRRGGFRHCNPEGRNGKTAGAPPPKKGRENFKDTGRSHLKKKRGSELRREKRGKKGAVVKEDNSVKGGPGGKGANEFKP